MSYGWEEPLLFDLLIANLLASLRHPVLDSFFMFITFWGSPLAFISLGLVGFVIMIYKGNKLGAIYLNLCLLATWQSMSLLKVFFARPRPSGEALTIATGMSFPSGHAMLSLAFYGFVAYLIAERVHSRKIKQFTWILFSFFILLIGVSRIYLNVHYPTDIIGGYLFGTLFLVFFIIIYKWHSRFNP